MSILQKECLEMQEKTEEELKERIYGLMNGLLDLENYPVKESSLVEDEFAEDKPCGIAYRKVLEANIRLCGRLGTGEEDPDVGAIIDNMAFITHHLCMKMFDYGKLFSKV